MKALSDFYFRLFRFDQDHLYKDTLFMELCLDQDLIDPKSLQRFKLRDCFLRKVKEYIPYPYIHSFSQRSVELVLIHL